MRISTANSAADRVQELDWQRAAQELDTQGNTMLKGVLSPGECQELSALYEKDELFRSRVIMSRHGFGRGEYKYFTYPLPPLVGELRTALYSKLAPLAIRWNTAMGIGVRYPENHAEFLQRCHNAGQTKPTPLLLKYKKDDYNCLHQDLYGEHVFPIQVAFVLS